MPGHEVTGTSRICHVPIGAEFVEIQSPVLARAGYCVGRLTGKVSVNSTANGDRFERFLGGQIESRTSASATVVRAGAARTPLTTSASGRDTNNSHPSKVSDSVVVEDHPTINRVGSFDGPFQ